MQLPSPGQWFQQRYELGELLGKGGFAAVFRAIDHDVGREVAIKILMPDHNGYEPGLVQRFMREGRIVAGLQDPHTITMYDFGRTEDDLLFMVFEYVPGSDLSKLLMRTGPMPEHEVIHVLHQLTSALREAHNAGILHRDIKPANVLIHSYMDDDRRVKLLDFGIAKPTMQEGEVDELEESTKSGMSPGTPRYMSPEQIYGDELTPASDIFSLGLVAYEMLSGKPAVSGRTTKETLLHQLSDKPIELPPFLRVSPELRMLVDTMTRKRPSERFQSISELQQRLSRVANASLSRPLPRPRDLSKRERAYEEPPLLSPQAKEKLSMVGLIALAVLVAGALFVPLSKVAKNTWYDLTEPPMTNVKPRIDYDQIHPEPVVVPNDPQEEPDLGPVDLGPPPSGCGAEPPFIGTNDTSTKLGVLHKRFVLSVPTKYDNEHEHPIILVFHGRRGARQAIVDSGLIELADKYQFIIAAPQARGNAANPWSPKADRSTIQAIIDHIAENWCVDRSRIFAYGHGLAGRMAEELPCEMDLAGVATTSFLPKMGKEELCKPRRATPTIQFFGLANRQLTMTGDGECSGVITVPLARREALGFKRNACEGGDIPWHDDHKHGFCFTRACPEAPFVSCRIEGAWEFWEDDFLGLAKGCRSELSRFNVPANIWRFFHENGRPI